jgi:xylan 1,4-beta-xylosidase
MSDFSLLEAVKLCDVSAVEQVLRDDPDAVKKSGTKALFQAAENGFFPVLKYLVEYSAVNLSDRDQLYRSALFYAVMPGNMDCIRYLTERGGLNPMEGDYEGKTPFDAAYELGKTEILKYFEEYLQISYENTFHNPILKGTYPDPSIVRVGEDYYMVNSSFCYFPCIPISHSRDLIHWEVIGHAITKPEYAHLEELESGRGYWAADISYYEGRFYIAATYRLNEIQGLRRMQMVTSAEKPEGPYEEPVFIEEDGIDPSIFNDEDGRRYMLLNRGARIFELSKDGKSKISEPQLLWYGNVKKTSEGPHLLKKDGYYYLIQAEGGTGRGHCITVSRSETLMGNYKPSPYNPLIQQRDEQALVQCCGHGKLVETQNEDWYLVYLCLRMLYGTYGILGRETALEPIRWTSDGWPVANEGRGPSVQQRCPDLPIWRSLNWRSLENAENVQEENKIDNKIPWTDLGWVTPRPPYADTIAASESLKLKGNGNDLNQLTCRSIYLQRQKSFKFTAECSFELPEALHEGGSLGMTCYYDENSYLKYGYGFQNDTYGILLEEYVGESYIRRDFIPFEKSITGSIRLKIETDNLIRTCFYQLPGEKGWHLTGVCQDTGYLSSEGLKKGKRFTGAMTGVYVHGSIEGGFYDYEIRGLKK